MLGSKRATPKQFDFLSQRKKCATSELAWLRTLVLDWRPRAMVDKMVDWHSGENLSSSLATVRTLQSCTKRANGTTPCFTGPCMKEG